jgi:hypothetical protein
MRQRIVIGLTALIAVLIVVLACVFAWLQSQ